MHLRKFKVIELQIHLEVCAREYVVAHYLHVSHRLKLRLHNPQADKRYAKLLVCREEPRSLKIVEISAYIFAHNRGTLIPTLCTNLACLLCQHHLEQT